MKLIQHERPRLVWPGFGRLTNLQDELDRLFESPLTAWSPALDVHEDKDGFVIRAELPGLKREDIEVSELTHQDLRRLVELWSGLLGRFGGPFLVGDWSIADAFFTPTATRLRGYGLQLSDYGDQGPCGAYAERLLQAPEFLEWEKGALADVRPAA